MDTEYNTNPMKTLSFFKKEEKKKKKKIHSVKYTLQ